jgi:metallo-beta-lactamase family protein
MKLTFYGGAKTVTGSNYMLESGGVKILIDCGLNQGSSYCENLNFEPFPYDPKEIEAVFVTHSHIDHIGRLPKLYKAGFRGKIYSTFPTRDFAECLLIDSEHILGEEAQKKKKPPIYSIEDVNEVMGVWEGVRYHQVLKIGPPAGGFKIEFYDAGHILGSSFISVSAEGKKVIFSGDLGNVPAPLVKDTETVNKADYVLVESTYGGRLHEDVKNRKDLLEDAIEETVKAGGVLLIPAFAMERTQELLYELNDLVENGRIARVPVFIDSPLAIKITEVYKKYSENSEYFDKESIASHAGGDQIFNFPGLKMTLTTEQSKEINSVPAPKIIIAGAGMSQGGRILHHELRYLPDPKSAILFIGYQAKDSLGRQIMDGVKKVRIMGEDVLVNCKVKSISGYSAHADQNGLLDWLRPMRQSVKKIFIVQGEEEQIIPLEQRIKDEFAVEAYVPSSGESVII